MDFLEFFEKFLNIKFHENRGEFVPFGRIDEQTKRRRDGQKDRKTERHDEINIRIRNFANAPKKDKI